jgi:hypothetical protein
MCSCDCGLKRSSIKLALFPLAYSTEELGVHTVVRCHAHTHVYPSRVAKRDTTRPRPLYKTRWVVFVRIPRRERLGLPEK